MLQQTVPEHISRHLAVRRLREALMELTDDDHSACQVAAERGIFCRGFRRYSDEQLRDRYGWLAAKYPSAGREEIESLANRWQLARQCFNDTVTSCDSEQREQDTCGGWDDFTNEDLARFCSEMLGQQVVVS